MFAYGQQISSMSRSGLFPKLLGKSYGQQNTPYAALITGSIISYFIMLACHLTDNADFIFQIFSICIIGSFAVYISLLVCYIIFKTKFSSLQRKYTSPFGIYSAVYGIIVFSIALVAAAFFQDDGYSGFTIFSGIIVVVTLYYIFVARTTQYFSDEEKAVMLIGYVIKSNTRSKA
eukprot:gene1928-2727_t